MIIHIIIYIIYCISILGLTFLTFILYFSNNKYRYLFSRNYNFYLLFVSFGILLDGIDIIMLGINKTEEKIYYLLKFNIVYIFDMISIFSYLYRGFLCLYNINDTNKKYIKHIYIIFLINIIYIITINMLHNKLDFSLTCWIFYPYYILVSIFTFVLHPLFIYKLKSINKKIRNDFIFSFIIISISFVIFILNSYFNYIEDTLYIKHYWSTICAFIVCIYYNITNYIINYEKKINDNETYFIRKLEDNNMYENICKIDNKNKNFIKDKINKIKKSISKQEISNILNEIEENIDNEILCNKLIDKYNKEINKIIYLNLYEKIEKGNNLKC